MDSNKTFLLPLIDREQTASEGVIRRCLDRVDDFSIGGILSTILCLLYVVVIMILIGYWLYRDLRGRLHKTPTSHNGEKENP